MPERQTEKSACLCEDRLKSLLVSVVSFQLRHFQGNTRDYLCCGLCCEPWQAEKRMRANVANSAAGVSSFARHKQQGISDEQDKSW